MADELFDEVLSLNDMLKNIPDETFNEDSPETKWMKLFSENDSLPLLYKLVAIVFSRKKIENIFQRVYFGTMTAYFRHLLMLLFE